MTKLSEKQSSKLGDIMLLFRSGAEIPGIEEMINKGKRKYVDERHSQSITRMDNASGYKKGKWKTYIRIDGKRKEIIRNTEEEIYETLYQHYSELENRPKTLADVFKLYADYKLTCLGRTQATVRHDIRLFNYLSEDLRNMPIEAITDSDIQKWVVKDFMKKRVRPTETILRKEFQTLDQTFNFGIRNKWCFDNPMRYITARDYLSQCNLHRKTNEEKEFSEEDLERIREASWKQADNPRALMRLFSMETGMRVGELPAVHKSDIRDGFIHVHRQQVHDWNEEGHLCFMEVPYTKDEKKHPHDGRYVPITAEAQKVIDAAMELPGTSEYLFHDNGKMVTKMSYEQNLKFFCRRLGLTTTNNHAFRMAFNSRLIELDFSASDRALILGHQVQTNETHYSLTDKRRLGKIKERLQ